MAEVLPFVPRIVSSREPVSAPAPEPVEVEEVADAEETLASALALVKADYTPGSEVFIIIRDGESQEVDFVYSTTTDLQKMRLIRAADAWMLED